MLRDEPLVPMEVVVVHGQHRGRLDPVERPGHAALTGDLGGPPHEHGVHDARDGLAPRREAVQHRREGLAADAAERLHVPLRFVPVAGEEAEAVVVAVRVRDVGDGAVVDLVVGGRQRGEHAPVRGHGGRERDPRARRGPCEALSQSARRVDVALARERDDQEVQRRHGR
ncbi:hypothetical protein VPH35_131444 [Triticum aestivum]